MLYAIAFILVVFWLIGSVTSYTLGGFIDLLLLFAIIAVMFNVFSGRKVV